MAGNVYLFKARAKSFAGGLEPVLSVAVDMMFPPAPFTAAAAAFQQKFSSTVLNFDVESSAVVEPVLNGRCGVGVVGSWSIAPPQLTYERLLTVRAPMVVSSHHPLAEHMIEADLASGALVQIRLEDSPAEYVITMSAIYRTDSPPGPAGRWFIDFLKQGYPTSPKGKAVASPPSTAKHRNSAGRR